jgi:hypothetical protein
LLPFVLPRPSASLLPWASFPFKVLPSTAVSVVGHPGELQLPKLL